MASAKERGILLYKAVKHENLEDIRSLLTAGAPTNIKAKIGTTGFEDIYDYARYLLDTEDKHKGFVTLVRNAGYPTKYLNERLANIVEDAFTELNKDENIHSEVLAMKALVGAGAEINGQHDGRFIAFDALSSASLIRVLLRLGLDPNLEDKHGISLLLYARHRGDEDVVRVLEAAGATGVTDKFIEDIEPRFGVELEICVKLTPACLRTRIDVDPRTDPWIKMFGIYAEHYIKDTPVAKRLASKYGYVYVTDNEKYGYSYIYDLHSFKLTPEKGKIAYDRPFFTIDRSVYCGDHMPGAGKPVHGTRRASREGRRMTLRNMDAALKNTFHIEFVSPILDNYDDLEDCLRLIGLGRPRCFISNMSAGFHVNASLINTKTGKQVALSKDFFEKGFYPRYKDWEAETYPAVRATKSKYAPPLGDIEDADVFLKTGKSKYVALYRKAPFLFEFRLFGSDNKVSVLTKYTKMAVELLAETYDSYNLGLAID
jgi:hypothetical protein